MPEAGWYPDPQRPDRLRYWDGRAWTSRLDRAPDASQTNDEPEATVSWWQQVKGPVIIGLVTVLAVGALLFGLNRLGVIGGDDEAASNPTEFCPPQEWIEPTPGAHPDDGRLHGGELSFPRQGAPWGPPVYDNRVPYGRDVSSQNITIEAGYQPGRNWVASLLVAELIAGDGFGSPRSGMDIVARCIVGAFYSDYDVKRRDVKAHALIVDGHEAWYLEMALSFDVPGLQADGETAILVIVNTSPTSNALYYASIPNNAGQYLPTARELIPQLRVAG